MPPASGDTIGGRYQLVASLASGGMGNVWRARHVELGVDVAVKLMKAAGDAGETERRRFRLEAQAAARLKSPHIVQVLDFGTHGDELYLAMELLEGEDLETRIRRVARLPPPAAATIVEGVAKALEVAHAAGIVHRDLKPANVFLAGAEELVKVLDFGVAKEVGASAVATSGATVVGSPAYMSPEQVWQEPLDKATDLWSLGVVALEMLTGKNPFLDDTLVKVFDHIIRDGIPRPRDLMPELSPAFDAFFERALARDREQRYPSAQALSDAFQEAARATRAGASQPGVVPAAKATMSDVGRAATATAITTTVDATRRRSRALPLGAAGLAAAIAVGLVVASRGTSAPAGPAEPSAPAAPSSAVRPPPEPSASSPSGASSEPEAPNAEPESTAQRPAPPSTRGAAVRPAPSHTRASEPAVDPLFGIPLDAGPPKKR